MLKVIPKSLAIFCFLIIFSSTLYSQVGIGTTNPAPGSILDIDSDNSGVLIPRVALVATNNQAPIIAPTPETGLLVFNTATVNDVTPGFYYWNGSQWVELSGASPSDDKWDLSGNAGTTPGTNFIGTSDDQDLVIATDGTERMRVDISGNIGIDIIPAEKLHVNGNLQLDGAFKPNGNSGLTANVLMSNGDNNPASWSTFIMGNTPATTEIAKYYITINLGPPGNWGNNAVITATVNDPACRPGSSISASIVGWQSYYNGIIIRNIATETGQFRITMQNLTGSNLSGSLQLAFIAFY